MTRKDVVVEIPSEGSDKKIDLAEELQKHNVNVDRDAFDKPFISAVLFICYKVFFFFYAVSHRVRYMWRQLCYSTQRQVCYRSRTPQRIREDVRLFSKVPGHVALVLKLPVGRPASASHVLASSGLASLDQVSMRSMSAPSQLDGMEVLLSEAVQGAVWCIGIDAHQLTLYERSGVFHLTPLQPLADYIASQMAQYFDDGKAPLIALRRHEESVIAGSVSLSDDKPVLTVTLSSEADGRPLLVELTREYAQQMEAGSLIEDAVTVAKVDSDVRRRVGDEPDLLVSFESNLDLAGFSPWLLRLTELYNLPDNGGVFHYMVFYMALRKFAHVKVNLGS